jgi:hypothetical protein
MKQNIVTLALLIAIIVLPMLTSLLLDWSFVQKQIVRQILVYLLILIEICTLSTVLLYYLKSHAKL